MANAILQYLLIIMAIIASCVADMEPKCSKFEFEERLLEKLVRMEHQNEVMMEEFMKISHQVKDDLETIKKEFDEIKRQANEEQGKWKKLIEEYLRRPSYAFNANWLANVNPANGEVLVFSRIKLNEGNVYNNYTGKYTAPLNGTYLFTTTLCFNSGKYAYMQFIAGGSQVGAFLGGNGKGYHCTSSAITVFLQEDMEFWLKVTSKSGTFHNQENYYLSNFAGHLINEV